MAFHQTSNIFIAQLFVASQIVRTHWAISICRIRSCERIVRARDARNGIHSYSDAIFGMYYRNQFLFTLCLRKESKSLAACGFPFGVLRINKINKSIRIEIYTYSIARLCCSQLDSAHFARYICLHKRTAMRSWSRNIDYT